MIYTVVKVDGVCLRNATPDVRGFFVLGAMRIPNGSIGVVSAINIQLLRWFFYVEISLVDERYSQLNDPVIH